MKKITVIILLAALCGLLTAQVTIGSDKAPVSGSLLQLKENETTDGSANTTHGLGMPRVKLTSKTNLYPMFETVAGNGAANTAYDNTTKKADEDAKHIGLMVYNTDNCFANATGLYVWDGATWQSLSEDANSLEGMAKKLGTAQNVIAPNGVAWHKDHEGNIFFSMNYDSANLSGNTNRWMTTNLATKTYGARTANTTWGIDGQPALTNSYNSDHSFTNACWGYPNPEGSTNAASATTYNANQRLGLIYTYAAASGNQNTYPSTASNVQGICPSGWHLPSDDEWTDLENEITANASKYSELPDNTADLGFAMMDMCENNTSQNKSNPILNGGFSILLAGIGSPGVNNNPGISNSLGKYAFFWTSYSDQPGGVWYRYFTTDLNTVARDYYMSALLYSVRCKKDAP